MMEQFVFAKPPSGDDAKYHALQVQSEDMQFTLLARFVVTWRDTDTGFEQCLGDLSTDRDDSPPCFLALGLSTSQELLLYFHLPLKINASSKGMKNTYLVVPAGSFNMAESTNSLELISSPQATPALSNAGVEAGAEILHARFALQQPGFVLMSAGKAQKPVNERSRGLLLSLKSLSQARSFDLYARNLGSNADVMRNFLQILSSGTCRSPEVDHKSTFNGRPWGINAWDSYKLRDDETLSKVWNPLFDEAPPSYEATVQSPSGQSSKEPAVSSCQKKGRASTNLHEASQSLPEKDSARDQGGEPEEENERRNDTAEAPGPRRVDLEELANPQAAELPDDAPTPASAPPTASTSTPAAPEPPQQPRLRKRTARAAHLSSPEPDDTRPPAATSAPAPPRSDNRRHKRVAFADPDPSPEQPAPAPSDDADPSPDPDAPLRLVRDRARCHPLSVLRSGPNRRLFDTTQYRLFCDAAVWLSAVWTRDHGFHASHLDDLRGLCRAIRRRDERGYDELRVRCMVGFVQGRRGGGDVEGDEGEDEGPFACEVEGQAGWMVGFLYGRFGRGADTLVVDELVALGETGRRWVRVGGGVGVAVGGMEGLFGALQEAFYFQMAACLLVACYKWGDYEGVEGRRDERDGRRRRRVGAPSPLVEGGE